MRILILASVIVLGLSLATQSSACDRHGGAFGQLTGASWADYNPGQSEFDSLLMEQSLSQWHKENAVPAEKVKPAPPSFSKASTRASMAAQERLAKRAKLNKEKAQASSSVTSATVSLKQPSR